MSQSSVRCVVDEITLDSELNEVAVLMPDQGGTITMSLKLLPEGTRLNDVIDLDARLVPLETDRRRQEIQSLQQRLFGHKQSDQDLEGRS